VGNKCEEQSAGSPAWMATFSDLMTQVLVFFVFLFTMSSIEEDKFRDAILSFKGSFGVLSNTVQILPPKKPVTQEIDEKFDIGDTDFEEKQLEAVMEELVTYSELMGHIDSIFIDKNEDGVLVSLSDKLIFKSGQVEINKEAYPLINKIAKAIKDVPNFIRVEGHTDNKAIVSGGKYSSNWELSTARAISMTMYLIEQKKILPSRLSIAGYGEHKPVLPNDSIQNRRRNRRVDIFFLKNTIRTQSKGISKVEKL
jgi:chemotaxis protein MotB